MCIPPIQGKTVSLYIVYTLKLVIMRYKKTSRTKKDAHQNWAPYNYFPEEPKRPVPRSDSNFKSSS